MADEKDFERGYHGHGSGVVVTQPEPGVFHERPMTAGELAARAPAWEIGSDPYEFLTRAAFVYIRSWGVIAPAIDAALAAQAAEHDRRVAELLAANNREVERRRVAETERDNLKQILDRSTALPRPADLRSAIADALPERAAWRIAEIRSRVAGRGIPVSYAQIYNVLDYMVRQGKASRLGRGRYAPAPAWPE